MQRLAGKTALVTGASRGIGRSIAMRLAADGAIVAVHYGSSAAAANEVVRAIEAQGGRAIAIGARLDTTTGAMGLMKAAQSSLLPLAGSGKLDILINNAGIGTSSAFEATTEEELDRLLAVNVKAPFFLVQQALPFLNEGGRIVNISSGVTRIAYPHIMAYNVTKGAINTFTLHLAQLLGPRGITVNAVLPGIVDTDANASWLHTPEGQAHASSMSALGRVGQPSDIADVVAFLVSADGRWVTGQMVDATGGSHL
ncbi:SDR family oxidoreductase [Paenibacillus xanthanilyticus]|uniref:SDR family oxidoreductase n=1 Tax=Paenibacillus xanthanilyticus TaxID=1783531 RepID=A0ABV8K3S3_9BACL